MVIFFSGFEIVLFFFTGDFYIRVWDWFESWFGESGDGDGQGF